MIIKGGKFPKDVTIHISAEHVPNIGLKESQHDPALAAMFVALIFQHVSSWFPQWHHQTIQGWKDTADRVLLLPVELQRPPPRPSNAHFIFRGLCILVHEALAGDQSAPQNPGFFGVVWRSLSLGQRQVFEGHAEDLKKTHEMIFPGYKYKPVHSRKNREKKSQAKSRSTSTRELSQSRTVQSPSPPQLFQHDRHPDFTHFDGYERVADHWNQDQAPYFQAPQDVPLASSSSSEAYIPDVFLYPSGYPTTFEQLEGFEMLQPQLALDLNRTSSPYLPPSPNSAYLWSTSDTSHCFWNGPTHSTDPVGSPYWNPPPDSHLSPSSYDSYFSSSEYSPNSGPFESSIHSFDDEMPNDWPESGEFRFDTMSHLL
ncbi:hypothetical protein C8J56DRAFT_1022505 [Mycena floridula]|nr:hypothetical protein C8J56DRAFT_1022505 [Mycena floridula]